VVWILRGNWYDILYLWTAIGLTSGGSSTVHIYTQTIHRTTQLRAGSNDHFLNKIVYSLWQYMCAHVHFVHCNCRRWANQCFLFNYRIYIYIRSSELKKMDKNECKILKCKLCINWYVSVNPLNAELNSICHLLALLGSHHILHVSRIRVNA
jgi:hypothetical protein